MIEPENQMPIFIAIQNGASHFNAQPLATRKDFIFQQAKDDLESIRQLNPEDVRQINEGYKASGVSYEVYVNALPETDRLRPVGDLIGKFIAYCDEKASGARFWNPERNFIAKASVRQPIWIKHILRYIESKGDSSILSTGVGNIIRYLERPSEEVPIADNRTRQLISEHILKKTYIPVKFPGELITFFQNQGLQTEQPNNFTIAINNLLFGELTSFWRGTAKFWRLGTRENEKSVWPEMRDNQVASIGWNDLGDLGQSGMTKDILKSLLASKDYNYKKNILSRKAGEIFDFTTIAATADIIVAVDGQQIKGIGKIMGDYNYDPDLPTFWHTRPVEWLVVDASFPILEEGRQTTFTELEKQESRDLIRSLLKDLPSIPNITKPMSTVSLNTILYGPPGTGKTYRTIDYSLAIIENKTLEAVILERETNEEAVKARFDEYNRDGRIAFCTFHQSTGYEDFIEGIKPQEPRKEGEGIIYRVEEGIFKQLSEKADSRMGNFLDVIEKLKLEISEADGKPPITIKSTGSTFDVIYKSGAMFYIRPHNSSKEDAWYPVSIENLEKFHNTQRADGIYNITYVRGIHQFLIRERNLQKETGKEKLPYVLIIDEINRGNVSQIFGELITLLEKDKRLGGKESLEIILPYSKKRFGVPPNLYIIGTMNTADRSVEALDTALRRRFSFVHMKPEHNELGETNEGIKLNRMLEVINQRLEILIDADHTIGHAWLWDVKDLEGLRIVFKNKILPLLQEFFYNDYEKIGLVLGEAFVSATKVKSDVFAKFNGGTNLGGEYSDRYLFTLKNPDDLNADAFISIYLSNSTI